MVALHPVVQNFFPSEEKADQDRILRLQSVREYLVGEKLFAVGEDADSLYLVLKGGFAVHKPIGLGGRTQVVAMLESGTVIGEAALVGGHRRGSTAVAIEQSVVAGFTRDDLREVEASAPALFIAFIKKVLSITSLRLQKSTDRLALVL